MNGRTRYPGDNNSKRVAIMWGNHRYIYLLDIDPDNPGWESSTQGVGHGSRGLAEAC